MRTLILLFLLSSFSQAALVGPDYYKTLLSKEAEGPTLEAFTLSVTTTINKIPEAAIVKIYSPGGVAAGDYDTAKGQPAVFRLRAGKDYRVEAFFPKAGNTAKDRVKGLSKNIEITLNLDYFTVTVGSMQGGKKSVAAAGTIKVFDRNRQAVPLASRHANGYDPASFYLEARKAYVFTITYDNKSISANLNGRVLYDLTKDTDLSFNF